MWLSFCDPLFLRRSFCGTFIAAFFHRLYQSFIYKLILTSIRYIGTNIISGEEVGIKLESIRAKHPQLEYEARVYVI